MADFGIWVVDEATKASHQLEQSERAAAEAMLEDVFVRNPALLIPGLELVGRQWPTANGYLDLLGVDSKGRLTVFELKREGLTRKAVAQALDYASWLDDLDDIDLCKRIAEHSGRLGIENIKNFEEWYESHDNWDSLETLTPARIVLVGLGADDSARRMVDWLVKKGVEIDLLTFEIYRLRDRVLFARQHADRDAARSQARQDQIAGQRATIQSNRRSVIERKVDEYGMQDWWRDVVAILERGFRTIYRENLAITFRKRIARTLSTDVAAKGTHKIEIAKPGVIRIIFFPAAVDVCVDEFEALKQVIPFDLEPPPNAPTTEQVADQWFCRLDKGQWLEHKNNIERLVRMVDERWREVGDDQLNARQD